MRDSISAKIRLGSFKPFAPLQDLMANDKELRCLAENQWSAKPRQYLRNHIIVSLYDFIQN
jgi:hypothetical protein